MASSDAIIRNTYRQLTGQEISDTLLNQARSVPDDQLTQFFSTNEAANDPAQNFLNKTLEDLTRPFKEAFSRAEQFDDENPFAFDEQLAQQSAEERFSPFYQAELRDYLTGVNRSRNRTIEDERQLRSDLNTTTEETTGKFRRNLEENIRSNEEGFASSGLFESGQRVRQTGLQEIEGEEGLSSFLRGQQGKVRLSENRQQRTLEDLASDRQTALRKQRAAKQTAIQTDVEQQRKEELKKRELARQNFIGFPIGGGTQSLSNVLGL